MLRRIPIVLALCCSLAASTAIAADQPASEASIKELLEVTHVHRLLDGTMAQVDAFMKQAV
jgi:hypothetical protein